MSEEAFTFTSFEALMAQAEDPQGRRRLSNLERAFYDAHSFDLSCEMSGYEEYFSTHRLGRVPDIIWFWRMHTEDLSAHALQGSLDLLMLSSLPTEPRGIFGLLASEGVLSPAWREQWNILTDVYQSRMEERDVVKDAFLQSLGVDPYKFHTDPN